MKTYSFAPGAIERYQRRQSRALLVWVSRVAGFVGLCALVAIYVWGRV